MPAYLVSSNQTLEKMDSREESMGNSKTRMMFANFEEELIENVKNFPVLYEPSHKEYRNLNYRSEVWEEIGQLMGKSGNQCKNSWVKLRNSYTNAMKRRKNKSDQGTKNLIKWKYEDHMSFLIPIIEPKTSCGTSDVIEVIEIEGETIMKEEAPSPTNDEIPPNVTFSVSSSQGHQLPKTVEKRRRLEPSSNEMTTIRNKSSVNPHASSKEMDLFFLSLSKTVQRLSPEEQVQVKMDVGNIVFQAELRELQCFREQQEHENAEYQKRNKNSANQAQHSKSSMSNDVQGVPIRIPHSPSSSISVNISPSPTPTYIKNEMTYLLDD